MTLSDVKLYLRVDGNAEDTLITQLMSVADGYMADAVTNYSTYYGKDDGYTARADMAKMAIIADLYENRNTEDPHSLSRTVQSIINQLNLTDA